jgi:hypothetical protein
VISELRFVLSDRALAAQVRGGGIGLEAGNALAITQCCVIVDKSSAVLPDGAGSAGCPYQAIGVLVTDTAAHAKVAIALCRPAKQGRQRWTLRAHFDASFSAAQALPGGVIVVGESRVRRGVAELADTTVCYSVPRMQSRIRERMLWTSRALERILSKTVISIRTRRTRHVTLSKISCATSALRLIN